MDTRSGFRHGGSAPLPPGSNFPTFHLVGRGVPVRDAEDEFTVAERRYHYELSVGVRLSRTLWASEAFRDRAASVRRSVDVRGVAWAEAGAYAIGDSLGRKVIAGLLVTAGLSEEHIAAAMLELIWVRPVDLTQPPARQYRRLTARRLEVPRRGCELIARRGEGVCLVPNCAEPRARVTVTDRHREYETQHGCYCAQHARDGWRPKADAKLIERVFAVTAAAFPTLHERELLRRYYAARGLAGV